MKTRKLLLVFAILTVGTYSLSVDDFSEQNVFERELVTEQVTAKSILEHHDKPSKNTAEKIFEGTTLAYVTPW